jgi:hypothetical protein
MDPARIAFALTLMALATPVSASTLFDKQELNQSELIVLAQPLRGNRYTLLLLQQIAGGQQCWQERRDAAGTVEMLLLNFDFTDSCERATDGNGYSLRMADEDLGLAYRLQIINQGDRAKLMAVPYRGNSPTLLVGQTTSAVADFMKIQLEPGWALTRRVYQGKPLSHFYFTHSSPLTAFSGQSVSIASATSAPLRPLFRPTTPTTPPPTALPPSTGQAIPIPVVRSFGNSTLPNTPSPNPFSTGPGSASQRTPINLGAPQNAASVGAGMPRRLPPPPSFNSGSTPSASGSPTPQPSRPPLRPLVSSSRLSSPLQARTASSSTTTARNSTPQVVDVDVNGQLGSNAYLVMIPAKSTDVQSLIQQLQTLRVPSNNLIERRIASRTGVAVGPFPDRQVAERWRDYLLRKGVNNAQLYFGR